jgi:hypothetical protein
MSASCPSAAWDRHIAELDDAALAEAQFFRAYRYDILKVACALIAGGFNVFEHGAVDWHGKPVVQGDVIKHAGNVVRLLNESGELE